VRRNLKHGLARKRRRGRTGGGRTGCGPGGLADSARGSEILLDKSRVAVRMVPGMCESGKWSMGFIIKFLAGEKKKKKKSTHAFYIKKTSIFFLKKRAKKPWFRAISVDFSAVFGVKTAARVDSLSQNPPKSTKPPQNRSKSTKINRNALKNTYKNMVPRTVFASEIWNPRIALSTPPV
jgi:hypothetical protein